MALKIYISGKVTGLPYADAVKTFEVAEKKVRDIYRGVDVEVINPMKLTKYEEGKRWADYMMPCLDALKDCDAIVMLANFRSSNGAKTELQFAKGCGMDIYYLAYNHLLTHPGGERVHV